MSSHDSLGDGQAHARAAYLVTLVSAPIELVEDQTLFERIDARAAVRHAEADCIAGQFCGNRDGLVLRRIQVRVVDQLYQDVASAIGIGQNERQLVTDVELERVVAKRSSEVLQRAIDQPGCFYRPQIQLNFTGFKARHVRGLFYQVIQAVAFFVDDRQELKLLNV